MESTGDPPSNNMNSNGINHESTHSDERFTPQMEAEETSINGETDIECNTLHQPLLKRNRTLSASHLAMVGAKVSYIESLDYEYNSLILQSYHVFFVGNFKIMFLINGYLQDQ